MIWFFGGGFHAGGASDLTEQGAVFAAEEDVVMINFNYRLGIFGFPGAPAQKQNLAFLDQRLVVEWVRDNAVAFGGDPARITLFGHSAGGASIDYYSYAWRDDPIVAGTIVMSGTATTFGHRTPETAVQAWDATVKHLRCNESETTSSPAVMTCMKEKGTEQVYNASLTVAKGITASLSSLDQTYAGITGIFSPTTDNETVFANYTTLGMEKKFIHRPRLTGNNDDEACLFSERGQFPLAEDPMLTEGVFTCPIAWGAIYRVSADLPTWKYRWFGIFTSFAL
jgi:carboxylesterase type B